MLDAPDALRSFVTGDAGGVGAACMVRRQFGLRQDRVAHQAGSSPGMACGERLRHLRPFPAIRRMAIGAIAGLAVNRPGVRAGWRVTFAANKLHRIERLVRVALFAAHVRVFAGQRDGMIKSMFGPCRIRRVAATARDRDTMGTHMAGLAILGTADLVLLVAFLAACTGHDTAQARIFVLWDNAAVAARASKGRVTMRVEVLRGVAHCAVAHLVRLGSGGNLFDTGNMH